MQLLVLVIVTIATLHYGQGLNNGLARTPPMGWLSWERFLCNTDCQKDPDNCISERLYMKMADLIVSEGYKDAGYEYVCIDDCWLAKERDSEGRLQPDPDRFPSGMKALARYVHSKGLKLGIYEDFGSKTCAGYPGSEFYLETDANTFASWEIDLLKFDGCNSDPKDMPIGYPTMGFFLNKTGRPIVYSCEWPIDQYLHGIPTNYKDVARTCNTWRNYNDIEDSWESVSSVIQFYGQNKQHFAEIAGPGGWNDPDELVVGDYSLSYGQQQVQFGMWSLFSAPLLMSVDLRTISQEAKDILLNKKVIAINQDPLGRQALQLYGQFKDISVWYKPLGLPAPGSVALGILNMGHGGGPRAFTAALKDWGFNHTAGYTLTDVISDKSMGQFKLDQEFTVYVDPTSLFILLAVPA